SGPARLSASRSACRRLPAPASASVVTVKVEGVMRASRELRSGVKIAMRDHDEVAASLSDAEPLAIIVPRPSFAVNRLRSLSSRSDECERAVYVGSVRCTIAEDFGDLECDGAGVGLMHAAADDV